MSRDPRKDRARALELARWNRSPRAEHEAAQALLRRQPHSLWSAIVATLSEMYDD